MPDPDDHKSASSDGPAAPRRHARMTVDFGALALKVVSLDVFKIGQPQGPARS